MGFSYHNPSSAGPSEHRGGQHPGEEFFEEPLFEPAMDIPLRAVPPQAQSSMAMGHPQVVNERDPSPNIDQKYGKTFVDSSVTSLRGASQPPLPLPTPPVYSPRKQLFWWAARYAAIFTVIFLALLIVIIVFANDAVVNDDTTLEAVHAKQYRNLVFYICLWLELTLVVGVFFDVLGLALPYIFRFGARYINPAHRRYWRILRFMRRPIFFLGTTIMTYIFFVVFINDNPILFVNVNKDPDSPYMAWDDIIADILDQITLWVGFYFVEKVVISYVAIHYHYRRTNRTLQQTKDIHDALISLYEASVYLHPVNGEMFSREDMAIRNAKGDMQASNRSHISSYLARLGLDGYKFTSLFGNVISDAPDAHWLRPGSSYAIIERAWSNRTSAEALARRIWMSLVPQEHDGLTANDIVEVLGEARSSEAKTIFRAIDQDDTGDMSLEDFIGMITEAGQKKHYIFRTIADMDHCINSLDWLCLCVIAAVMVLFIMLQYVPAIKAIQTVLSSLAIGLSFAVGRTINHLLTGIIFVFFDHPFDSGDIVRIRDKTDHGIVCRVKRQSLIYTIFQRLDNNSDLQLSNDELLRKTIENYTRSDSNRQRIVMFIDFRTSFTDLDRLRVLLDEFVKANERDYVPGTLAVNVTSLHELNKMELAIAFTHRNNWSDDKLRSIRSNKFYCNLVATCRKIPLFKPGALLPAAGENGNPLYTTQLSPPEVAANIQMEKDRRQGLRWDDDDSKTKAELDSTTTSVKSPEEKAAAAAKAEQDAFEKVAKTGKRNVIVATGVAVARQVTGLRQTATRYEEV
ncbi:hypothetical protein NQ176_g3807 [Zarea fungicola]|uniref:Uncharacterized protein n=1 Tax=Zarea fungicola TaxID=93591 RepID=A0ACC1NHQ0_9HYPO|nr:hypothetical protein NQ176_g3807 [Lecanicillium fungicola]